MRALACLLLLLLLVPLHIGGLRAPRSIRQHDEGIYVVLARSIARGEGYRLASVPGAPLFVKYPPLAPAIFAAAFRAAGDGEAVWRGLRAAGIGAAVAFALLAGALAARAAGAPPAAAAGMALAIGAWPSLVEESALLLSDVPFALLAVLALRAVGSAGGALGAAVAVVLSLGALATRAAGLAVVAAVAAGLWNAGRRRHAMVLLGLAFGLVLAWVDRVAAATPAYASPLLHYYLGYGAMEYAVLSPADLIRIWFAHLGGALLRAPAGALGPAFAPPVAAAVAGGIAVAGAALRLRRNGDALDAFLLLYLAGVAAFPALDDRYLLPLLPALAASILRALGPIVARGAAGVAVLLLGLSAWGLAIVRPADVPIGLALDRASLERGRPGLAAALDWIEREAPPGPIAGDLDPYYFLTTGRAAVRPYRYDPARLRGIVADGNPLGTSDEIDRSLRAMGVRTVIDDGLVPGPEGAAARRLLRRIVDDPARGWRRAFEAGGVAVYVRGPR